MALLQSLVCNVNLLNQSLISGHVTFLFIIINNIVINIPVNTTVHLSENFLNLLKLNFLR